MPRPLPPRPPSGEAGRDYIAPAHRERKRRAAERYIDKIKTTWPALTPDQLRQLANRLTGNAA